MITLFTCPKPFLGPAALIQRNAVGSWIRLGPEVEVLLIGDEAGVAEAARELGAGHLPDVDRNEHGTPRLDSIFARARQASGQPYLAYANADIILLDDFLPAVRRATALGDSFLIVGQRWDLAVSEAIDFRGHWEPALRQTLGERGRRHPPAGSDYFVFPRGGFAQMPAFALGRAGWDNWMIFQARRLGWPVIDASRGVTVVHQDHDYRHLPGGQPHYRLPESAENLRLAGGRETVFTLADADWRLDASGLARKAWRESGILRRLEAGCIARLGPGRRARLVRLAFHPWDAAGYYLGVLRGRLSRLWSAPRAPETPGQGKGSSDDAHRH